MKQYLFFLIACIHILLAEEEPEFSLVNLTQSPIPKVAGTVNIITGNWVDQTIHHKTTGPDPYVVAHSYVSASLDEGTLADGWDLYHPSELEVLQPKGILCVFTPPDILLKGGSKPNHPKKPGKPHHDHKAERYPMPAPENIETKLFYREAGGAVFLFKGDYNARHFQPLIHKTGYCHISSIESPVRRDVRQTTINWDKSHDEWIIRLGDGTKRTYACIDERHRRPLSEHCTRTSYLIKEEILPSGNKRWYHYDSDHELSSIQTVSSDGKHLLHFVEFQKGYSRVKITSSEGVSTTFSLKKIRRPHSTYVVTGIDCPGKGPLSFSYSEKSSRHAGRINHKYLANGRTDTVLFYLTGNDSSDKKEKKFLGNRVRMIWTQQLSGEKSKLSHRFAYKEWDGHSKAIVKESDNAATTYMWDAEHRPTRISFASPEGLCLASEQYIWGKDKDEGRLVRKTNLDGQGHPLLDHEFEFDSDGNVTQEILRGLFTGYPTPPLTIDDHKCAHGGETLIWKAEYTKDGRHLKKAEVDPLGNWTYYEYDDTRHLLTARFTCDKDLIIKREFFSYDSAAVCIEEIIDDGSSRQKDDLSTVCRRYIHRIIPRCTAPYYGAPDEERWYIWTPSEHEQLLKVERSTRDTFGRVVVKELLDAFGTVHKRWTYSYDKYHRIIESSDPTGRAETITYDAAGRIATKRTKEAIILYTYDLLDRIIEERKLFLDGTVESSCHQYDLPARMVSNTDSRGRVTTQVKDICGRLIKTQSPQIPTEQGAIRPEETIQYEGFTEHHTSSSGAVTSIVRSSAGKPFITTNSVGASTYYFYDGRNRLVEQRDPSGSVTTYEYDAQDRPTKLEQRSNDQVESFVTKRYQGFDLIEERDPTKVITYTYDSLGRKSEEKVTDLITHQESTTIFDYDTLHRLTKILHKELGTYEELTYDEADRVIAQREIGT